MRPVAAPHAEFAEPTANAGHIGSRAGQFVSADSLREVVDRLVSVRPPGVQDAEILRCGGPGPRVGVLRGGLGEAGRVLAGKSHAVSRGSGDGRISGTVARDGFGIAGGDSGQLIVARGQRGAYHPGRKSGVAE